MQVFPACPALPAMAPTEGSILEHKGGEKKTYDVPVIDLTDIEGPGRARICEEIARACETWCVFQVVNHGVDSALIERVMNQTREFFRLTDQEKSAYAKPAGFFEDGYELPVRDEQGNIVYNVENLSYTLYPSDKRNQQLWPSKPPGLRLDGGQYLLSYFPWCTVIITFSGRSMSVPYTLDEYGQEMRALAEKLLAEKFNGRSREPLVVLRGNFYPLVSKNELTSKGGAHAHTDVGGITLLLQDLSGLEVEMDGEWVQIEPLPNTFCVNMGDQIEALTNGRYRSIQHRAFPNCVDNRLSVVAFVGPSVDNRIGPLEDLLDESHPPKYETLTLLEYVPLQMEKIMQKIRESSGM